MVVTSPWTRRATAAGPNSRSSGREACISRRRVPLPRDLSLNAEITWAAMAFLASCATEFASSVKLGWECKHGAVCHQPQGQSAPGRS